jgi:hypothetical protein
LSRVLTHHICSLSPSNGEFEVGIFLPVSEEEREFAEEAVVDVSGGGDGL